MRWFQARNLHKEKVKQARGQIHLHLELKGRTGKKKLPQIQFETSCHLKLNQIR